MTGNRLKKDSGLGGPVTRNTIYTCAIALNVLALKRGEE